MIVLCALDGTLLQAVGAERVCRIMAVGANVPMCHPILSVDVGLLTCATVLCIIECTWVYTFLRGGPVKTIHHPVPLNLRNPPSRSHCDLCGQT